MSQRNWLRRLGARETVVAAHADPNHDTAPEKIQAALEVHWASERSWHTMTPREPGVRDGVFEFQYHTIDLTYVSS